jgi:hypothetical protein
MTDYECVCNSMRRGSCVQCRAPAFRCFKYKHVFATPQNAGGNKL